MQINANNALQIICGLIKKNNVYNIKLQYYLPYLVTQLLMMLVFVLLDNILIKIMVIAKAVLQIVILAKMDKHARLVIIIII